MRLDLKGLAAAYDSGTTTPAQLIGGLLAGLRTMGPHPVWISLLSDSDLALRLEGLARRRAEGCSLPLYGVPFAVKDNIDVAGLPTTAGCPAFAFQPAQSAPVVQRLEAAGAIPLGKTNLDQFATGLVGTRSPYGAPSSVFDPAFISGGSSSGSAVAVAAGWASFALGTDTAGSGRVPAAFNNIVGLKPTKGLLSGIGLLPACRSLDCISIFAGCVDDAEAVLRIAATPDPADAFSRAAPAETPTIPADFRFGVPELDLDFCGDAGFAALYQESILRLENLGGTRIPIDFTPFAAAAALLYQGPFVAERLAALQLAGFTEWSAMDPVVAGIIKGAEKWSATDSFKAEYELARLKRVTEKVWQACDCLLLPTAPTIFTHAEIAAEPITRNAKLGLYTNFVNLLDLAAIAVPAGFRPDGLPFGVSLIAPAFSDHALAGLGDRLHRSLPSPRWGGSREPLPPVQPAAPPVSRFVTVAVVGAHLSGQPLNHQLQERRARLIKTCRTATGYRLYALSGTVPPKPGLMRDPTGAGLIEVELWEMDSAAFGSFTDLIPPPLGIGTLSLEDGSLVKGFICEAAGLDGARDITAFGGWRAFRAALSG